MRIGRTTPTHLVQQQPTPPRNSQKERVEDCGAEQEGGRERLRKREYTPGPFVYKVSVESIVIPAQNWPHKTCGSTKTIRKAFQRTGGIEE